MIEKKILSKSFLFSAIGSTAVHLVFAMTAGAYFLTREPPPEKHEISVKIIEKEKPDRKEKKERKVKPVLEVVPVIQPQELTQPAQPQQVVQVASVQTQVDVQPMMMQSVPTNTASPKNAKVTSHVSSRAMTAANSTPRPMRSTAVATVASSSNNIKRRTSNVSAYTMPDATPVMKPTTSARPVMTASRTGIKHGRAVSRVTSAPAPMATASSNVMSSGTKGTSLKHSSAVAVASASGRPRAIAPAMESGPGGTGGVGLKKSAARPAQLAALAPVTASPVEAIEEAITDPEARAGYERQISRRLQYVAQKHYKRSRAKKTRKEGRLEISFILMRDGSVKNAYVKTPNQFASVNQVALEALEKAAPFSEFPEEVVEDEFEVTVPFNFSIR